MATLAKLGESDNIDILHAVLDWLDFKTLKNFSVCSRRSREQSVPKLFYAVGFVYREGAPGLEDELASTTCPFVRSITLSGLEPRLQPPRATMLAAFPNLRELSLKGLHIDEFTAGEYQGFAAEPLQHIHTLRLLRCVLSLRDVLEILRMKNLRTLTLDSCGGSDYTSVDDKAAFQQLRELEASSITDFTIDIPPRLDTPVSPELKFLADPILPRLSNVRRFSLYCDPEWSPALPSSLPFQALEYFETYPLILRDVVERSPQCLLSVKNIQLLPQEDFGQWLDEASSFVNALRPSIHLRTLHIIVTESEVGSEEDDARLQGALDTFERELPDVEISLEVRTAYGVDASAFNIHLRSQKINVSKDYIWA